MHPYPRPYAAAKPLALLIAATFSAPLLAQQAENTLAEVKVKDQASKEQAYGPVQGYRATRSASFTKTDTALKEIPASVSVIPSDLMKDQAMQSVADAVRYVPGATMGTGEGNRDQPVLRGISTTSDFFVDGIREDTEMFRDLYNLERLEVLKGPAGMAFGRGGAGGLINRVTKRADFASHSDVTVSVGSKGQMRSTGDFGGKFSDTAAWRLNLMGEDSKGFRDHFYLKRQGVNPTITLAPGGNTTLTLGYEYLHDKRLADRGIPSKSGRPFETSREQFFGNPDQSVSETTTNSFYAILDHTLESGANLRNHFRVSEYEKFYANVYPRDAVTSANQVSIGAYNASNDRTNFFNQTDLTFKFETGGLKHTLLTGVELGHQKNIASRYTGPNSLVSAGNPITAPVAISTLDRKSASTADIFAVYVQDQIALNPQWKVTAGLRYDDYQVKFDDQKGTADLSRNDKAFSPRLGLVWQPDGEKGASTYYASYSYSFLPSGDSLSLATNTAELKPEEAINYEIGARWDILPKLTLGSAVFRTDRDGVKTRDPLDLAKLQLTGLQRTEGLELSLQGEVTRNWNIYASAAFLDGRTMTATGGSSTANPVPAGRTLALVPKQTASIWNKVDLAGGWGAGLGLVYQGEVYASTSNAVKLPSFTRVDGAVYYRFADNKTRLALNVENLFDKKYYPSAHNDNNIATGAPRGAMLTVSTKF